MIVNIENKTSQTYRPLRDAPTKTHTERAP